MKKTFAIMLTAGVLAAASSPAFAGCGGHKNRSSYGAAATAVVQRPVIAKRSEPRSLPVPVAAAETAPDTTADKFVTTGVGSAGEPSSQGA